MMENINDLFKTVQQVKMRKLKHGELLDFDVELLKETVKKIEQHSDFNNLNVNLMEKPCPICGTKACPNTAGVIKNSYQDLVILECAVCRTVLNDWVFEYSSEDNTHYL